MGEVIAMRGAKPSGIIPGSSPVEGDIEPPDWLDADARAEWTRVAPTLIQDRRTLTVADLATFANYCVAVAQVMQASRTIAEKGLTYVSKTGPKKHPAVAIRSDAMTQARLLAAELGLTPVSRSRPSVRSGEGTGQPSLFDEDFQ